MINFRAWTEEDGTRVYLHEASDSSELASVEAEIRETAAKDGTSERAVFGANAVDEMRARFLTDNGYKQVFSLVYLELDDLSHLPNASLPTDFDLRIAASEDVRALWELNNLAYAGRDFVGIATEQGFANFAVEMSDLSLVTVAEYGTEIAGFVSSQIRDSYAEVTEVTVHPDYRRRGLASAILATNLNWVRERRINAARLHTNGEDVSGARSLYETFEFRTVETHLRFRKPLSE